MSETTREEPSIAEVILEQVARMRQEGTFATDSLCLDPEGLELLAMYAIDAKNRLAALRETPEPVAWMVENASPTASPRGRAPFVMWSDEDAERYANDDERRFTVTPLYTRAAPSRSPAREGASDTERIDWLEARDIEESSRGGLMVNLQSRLGTSLRARIDAALRATPTEPTR